jgi:hypothetical protein
MNTIEATRNRNSSIGTTSDRPTAGCGNNDMGIQQQQQQQVDRVENTEGKGTMSAGAGCCTKRSSAETVVLMSALSILQRSRYPLALLPDFSDRNRWLQLRNYFSMTREQVGALQEYARYFGDSDEAAGIFATARTCCLWNFLSDTSLDGYERALHTY